MLDNDDITLGINERVLTATEALHFINHTHLPSPSILPEPDLLTSSGQQRWNIDTIRKISPPIQYRNTDGKCYANTDLFFSEDPEEIEEAKRKCASCPIVNACARVVLSLTVRQSKEGVWAGTDPEERRKWRSVSKSKKKSTKPSISKSH